MVSRYTSKNDSVNYNAYRTNNTIVRKQTLNSAVHYKKDEFLESVVSYKNTVIKQQTAIQKDSIYLFGENNIPLTTEIILNESTTNANVICPQYNIVTLGLTRMNTRQQYSTFNMNKFCNYTLVSLHIPILSTITKNGYYHIVSGDTTSTLIEIDHNLSGIIDFSLRERQTTVLSCTIDGIITGNTHTYISNEIYNIPHNIIDGNTLQLQLSGFPNGQEYDLTIWKISSLKNAIYKNVFTMDEFNPNDSSVKWNIYDNDEEFDLNLNYRFSFIGYMTQYATTGNNIFTKYSDFKNNVSGNSTNLPKIETDTYLSALGFDNPSAKCLIPKAETIRNNTSSTIEHDFQYMVDFNDNLDPNTKYTDDITKYIRVTVPNFDTYNNLASQCQKIYIYNSILSKTFKCSYKNRNIDNNYEGIWTTYDKDGKITTKEEDIVCYILTLTHNLNGLVKINIRNYRNDHYQTYITDTNTIKIVFQRENQYKTIPTEFLVDIFVIWRNPDDPTVLV